MATAKAKAPARRAPAQPAPAGWIEEPGPPAPAWSQAPPPSPPPQAGPFDERNYAMLLHLSALAGIFIGFFFLGPLVMWLVKKDQSAFVDRHGRAALDFQISMFFILAGAVLVLMLIAVATLGIGVILLIPFIFVFAIGYFVVNIVFPIIAGVKANHGQPYDYPMSFRMLRRPAQ